MRRRRDDQRAIAFGQREPEPTQSVGALRLGQRHADDARRACDAQGNGFQLRQVQGLVVDRSGLATTDIDDQLRDTLDDLNGAARVDTPLETMAGIGREIEAPRAPLNSIGPPERGLNIDVARVVRHGCGIAAHDAGKRFDFALIGDHTDLVVDRHGVPIEQLELLGSTPPTYGEAAVNLVEVEDVRGLAVLEHHVVRDVDQRGHTALTATGQPVDHPRGSLRFWVDTLQHAARKAAAEFGRFDLHCKLAVVRRHDGRRCGCFERRTSQCGQLARHAVHAEAVRQVGCELQREQHVVELQHVAHVDADRRICSEFEQATVVFAELQLARRAQHAFAFHTTQLAELDEERLAVFSRRQFGANKRARHLDSDACVGCAADDVQQDALPDIDLTNLQAIGIRMLRGFLDFTNYDLRERRRGEAPLFDLETAHRECVSQLDTAEWRVAELAQPGLGKLHLVVLVFVYWNCDKKRRSPSKKWRRSFTP